MGSKTTHRRAQAQPCDNLPKPFELLSSSRQCFLRRVVTGEEKWIHHYEPESKCQSVEWKHLTSPLKNKFKSQQSAGIFWDSQGPIFEHYQEGGITVSSVLLWNATGPVETSYSIEMLGATVKRCCIVAWQCPFTHCRPYCGNPPATELCGVGASSVQSWPGPFGLSPVWSTRRCFKRPPLCQWPACERCGACVAHHSAKNSFFPEDIQKLVNRWTKCVEKEGD